MSGSSNQPTQTTTAAPSPQQSAILNAVTPNILGLANKSPPQYYPDNTVVPFNPTQEAAQTAAIQSAAPMQDIAQWSTTLAKALPNALQWGLPAGEAYTPASVTPASVPTSSNIFSDPGIWNPEANQGLQQAIQAATRPIYQGLTEQALPAIRGTAVSSGSYGGSRQGIAEGLATSRADQAAADTAAKMANDMYAANLNAVNQRYGQNLSSADQVALANLNAQLQLGQQGVTARGQDLSALGQQYGQNLAAIYQTLGMAPSLQAQWAAAPSTIGAVGDAQQAQQQAQLSADVAKWNFNQQAPYAQIQELLGLSGAMPGGTTTSTANTPTPNPVTTALGGAATGAAVGSAIPVVGAPIGAATGAGAALLPFLFR